MSEEIVWKQKVIKNNVKSGRIDRKKEMEKGKKSLIREREERKMKEKRTYWLLY